MSFFGIVDDYGGSGNHFVPISFSLLAVQKSSGILDLVPDKSHNLRYST